MPQSANRSEEEIAIRRWENEGGEIPELAAISNLKELRSATAENKSSLSQGVKAKVNSPKANSTKAISRIIGFHQDDDQHWVAELECGHQQHVRHDPPLTTREWVMTAEGRRQRIGYELHCNHCETQSSMSDQ